MQYPHVSISAVFWRKKKKALIFRLISHHIVLITALKILNSANFSKLKAMMLWSGCFGGVGLWLCIGSVGVFPPNKTVWNSDTEELLRNG